MKIIQVPHRQTWSNFVLKNQGMAGAEFLLSPEWFDVLQGGDEEVRALAVINDLAPESEKDFLALIVLVRKSLGRGFFYWYAPRGPLLRSDLPAVKAEEVVTFLIKAIRRIEKKALFLKVEPANEDGEFWRSMFPTRLLSGVFRVREVESIQPQRTLVLNLKQTEADLMANLHQKTRYNLRLAQKKGVKIVTGSIEDFTEFWRLMQLTGGRDGFRLHQDSHYKRLLSAINSEKPNFIKLFFAEHEGKKIATALYCGYHRRGTYLHGGSDHSARDLMAPYLLQWQMISEAKEAGFEIYDFYGIDEKKWPGVTRFKRGFNGEERLYPGAFDIVFRPAMYRSYRFLKRAKKFFNRVKNY